MSTDHFIISIHVYQYILYNTTVSDVFDNRILGTDANHGQAGTFSYTFKTTGTLVYYCKFHAKLDSATHQLVPIMAKDPPLPTMMGSISILP